MLAFTNNNMLKRVGRNCQEFLGENRATEKTAETPRNSKFPKSLKNVA
jgi:hypothetical protein